MAKFVVTLLLKPVEWRHYGMIIVADNDKPSSERNRKFMRMIVTYIDRL